MPWSVEQRGDEWCVIKESDGSKAGCHASKSRAVAQQRALYAQEAQTASVAVEENGGPMRVEIAAATSEADEALLASIGAVAARLEKTEAVMVSVVDLIGKVVETLNGDREEFTKALTAAANQPEPVVNVYVPEIVIPEQPSPTVNVHVPKSQILVPQQPTPVVNVTLPGTKKTVKFTRNLQGEVESADIQEELDGG